MKRRHIVPLLTVLLAFAAGIVLATALGRMREDAAFKRLENILANVDDQSKIIVGACAIAKRSVVGIEVVSVGEYIGGARGSLNIGYKRRQKIDASGVIIDPEGYIVTNTHVVRNGIKGDIVVTLEDNRQLRARIVGTDPRSDIAVIKIEATDLPVAMLGDSDSIEPGQLVCAIGNPFGFSHSVSLGVVSATDRRNVGAAMFEDYIQTDAAINPGSSGGPLVNMKGEVIGITANIASSTGTTQGVGLAIPINMVTRIKDKLIEGSLVPRGLLGVNLQEMSPLLAESFGIENESGVLVLSVLSGSPAENAGIMAEDIILSVNDEPVKGLKDLQLLIGQAEIGETVEIYVLRDKTALRKEVVIQDYDRSNTGGASRKSKFGITVAEISSDEKRLYHYYNKPGIIITRVEPGSPAHKRSVLPGMLIQKINGKTIRDMDDYERIAPEIKDMKTIRLKTLYFNKVRYVALEL